MLLILDRHYDKWRKGARKLTDLCRHYGVTLGNAHSAAHDAEASLAVFEVMCSRYPAIRAIAPGDLNATLRGWYQEWLWSFSQYLERKGEPPIQPGQLRVANSRRSMTQWSGWGDLNSRSLGPQPSALDQTKPQPVKGQFYRRRRGRLNESKRGLPARGGRDDFDERGVGDAECVAHSERRTTSPLSATAIPRWATSRRTSSSVDGLIHVDVISSVDSNHETPPQNGTLLLRSLVRASRRGDSGPTAHAQRLSTTSRKGDRSLSPDEGPVEFPRVLRPPVRASRQARREAVGGALPLRRRARSARPRTHRARSSHRPADGVEVSTSYEGAYHRLRRTVESLHANGHPAYGTHHVIDPLTHALGQRGRAGSEQADVASI